MTNHLSSTAAAWRVQSPVIAATAQLMHAINPPNRALADMAIRATQARAPQSPVVAATTQLMHAINPPNRALADMAIRATQARVPQSPVVAATAQLMHAINPPNRALADMAVQAARAQVQSPLAAATARLAGAINPQPNRALADMAFQAAMAARASINSPLLDLGGVSTGATARMAADALRPLAADELVLFVREATGAATPSTVSRGVLERMDAARLSPAAQRRVLVSFVFLIVFVTLASLAVENLEDAKALSVILGAGSYQLAKDAAGATNKLLKKYEDN